MVVLLRGYAASAGHLTLARAELQERAEADEGARLESECLERHRATPRHVNAHAISELALQNDSSVCVCKPRCSSRFRASRITVLSQVDVHLERRRVGA